MMIENQRQISRLQRGPVRTAVVRAVIFITAALIVLPSSVLIAAPSSAAPKTPTAPKAPTTKCPTTPGILCVQAAQSSIAPPPAPRKFDQPTEFKWLLNADTTGTSALLPDGKTPDPAQDALCHPITPTNPNGNANYPTGCPWPSVRQLQSSPVVSTGNQADWNPTTPLPLFDGARGLKDGRYLVSVTSNGYQIGGAHFAVSNGQFSGPVIVSLNPWPIPLATVKLKVFSDMASSNGQWDEQTEPGLAGFTGNLVDYDGVVSVDYYGNPLCTAYQATATGQVMLGLDGKPLIDHGHHWAGKTIVPGPSTGSCVSDAAGDITIPNMAPNRYASSVLAPQGTATVAGASNGAALPKTTISIENLSSASGFPTSGTFNVETSNGPTLVACSGRTQTALTGCRGGSGQLATGDKVSPLTVCPVSNTTPDVPCWVQTTTLEGNHDFDVWATGNDQGVDTELVVGGEPVPFVHFGFTLAGCMTDSSKSIDAVNFQSPAACHNNFPLPPKTTVVPAGGIKGKIMGANSYFPGLGGLPGTQGNVGVAGYKYEREVKNGWVALSDLNNNDKTEYGAPANPDGTFQINGVPDGSYSLSIWDQPQDYIFDSMNVSVVGGQIVDLGVMPLLPWFTRINGKVCIDKNGNGRCDPGEPGVPEFTVQNLDRTNNTYEQGQNLSKTDDTGHYEFTEAYPLGSMNVIQAFNTRWKTTGVTWQSCNDGKEHTTLTGAVDVSYQPIISQCGRLDWAVQPYTPSTGDNGGIVATVLNASMRAKFMGRGQTQFDHFVGVPGVLTELFAPVKDASGNYVKNGDGSYKTTGPTGGYTVADRTPGNPNAYTTEHYGRPTGCVSQDANGHVIQGTVDANGKVTGPLAGGQTVTDFLPGIKADNSQACLETPATGVSFGLGTDNLPIDPSSPGCQATPNDPVACPVHGTQTVDGNFALTPPAAGNYLAKVSVPVDTVLPQVDDTDRPLFKVVGEQDINHSGGIGGTGLLPYNPAVKGATVPQFIPQGADLTHVYNDKGQAIDIGTAPALDWPPMAPAPNQQPAAIETPGAESPSTYTENPGTYSPAPDPQCAGAEFVVNATDPTFVARGGSPLQGLTRNSCDVHLLHLGAGQSIAPNFYLYTDVPLPTVFQVQNFDDTNLSTTKRQTQFGDAAPIPNSPEGVYDWAGNLVARINTDPNGIAEVLLPSTDVANCATPAGICQNTYRFVGNDPGTPDHPNPNFNPQMQTITATFQALPGIFEPADTAPTRSAIQFINSGQKFTGAATCWTTQTGVPQLFSVDKPFTTGTGPQTVAIKGVGFGTSKGKGAVLLKKGTQTIALPTDSWNDSEIKATVRSGVAGGAYQLMVRNDSGQTTLTGITFHVVRGSYTPKVLEVSPTFPDPTNSQWNGATQFPSIQEAIERAAGYQLTQQANGTLAYQNKRNPLTNAVVVVYPNTPTAFSPLSTWYEPIILHSAVHVQGVGPGGVIPAAAPSNPQPGHDTAVPGTVIDSRYFFALLDTTTTPPRQIDWTTASQDAKAQHAMDVWRTVATALYPNTPGADNKTLTEGQVATVLAQNGQPAYTAAAHPQLDGVSLTGGITENFPTNVNQFTGQKTGPAPTPDVTQGGALFLNGHTDWTQITNDVIQGNQGSYGAVRIGTPQLQGQHNWHVEVAHTQLVANGGNNLGGGMAIFNDAGGYNVHDNLICGNQSAEYGGGMSQYGLSIAPVSFTGASIRRGSQPELSVPTGPFLPGDVGSSIVGPSLTNATIARVIDSKTVVLSQGSYSGGNIRGLFSFEFTPTNAKFQTNHNTIDHNQIYMNQAIDEGGGIAIAGELPTDSTKPSKGTGPVNITSNKLAVNNANDDGGGIRFLMAGNFPMRVDNNVITDNVSAHEGGGISIDDTPQVTIINNTIAKNLTTATAKTSNGTAAPAGISTAQNSVQLQKRLPAGSSLFSKPVIANNILWDNRAGSWSPHGVVALGLQGDATPINVWDIGSMDNIGLLTPVGSLLSTNPNAPNGQGYTDLPGSGNVFTPPAAGVDPKFTGGFDLEISVQPLRTYFRFRPTAIVNISLPPNGVGDYHIQGGSSAATIGQPDVATQLPFPAASIVPPGVDVAGALRPITPGHIDAGGYQITGP
jgi:hypothetical protein